MAGLVRAHTMPYIRSRNRFATATATGLPQYYYPARRQTAFTRSILAGGALPVTAITAPNQSRHTTTFATTDAKDGVITTENPIQSSVSSGNKQIESGVKPFIVRPAVSKGPQKESGNRRSTTSMPPADKDEKEDEDENEDNEEGMNEEEDGDSCGDYDSEGDDDDDDEDQDDEDDEYDEGDDVRIAVSAPKQPNVRRGNKSRRRYFPRLNNFFPVIFSLPRASKGRRGSSSTSQVPRLIAAVANSYSTAKGGIANSVATAYGLPTKRPRRKSLKDRTKPERTH